MLGYTLELDFSHFASENSIFPLIFILPAWSNYSDWIVLCPLETFVLHPSIVPLLVNLRLLILDF
jgi:hypothetical protein